MVCTAHHVQTLVGYEIMSDATTQPATTSNVNIPNILTSIRIILIPLFVWLLLSSQGTKASWLWAAFACFACLMITDKLDGDIARKYNIVTTFGKIADPIADKALMGSALISLNILGLVPVWITVVILVREIGITLWRMVELRKGNVVPASKGGKLKTVVQTLAVALYLLPLPVGFANIQYGFMLVAVAITAVTGMQYLYDSAQLKK